MKREISNYPGYFVTENGDVFHNEKKLKPFKVGNYEGISLCKKGKTYKHYIHRLVAMMFLNNGLDFELTVNHKDGNKKNNQVSNLEIVSQRDNNLHALRNGLRKPTHPKGELNGNSKLTERDVSYIRKFYKPHSKDFSRKKLSEKFGVTPEMISRVIHRKSWTSVFIFDEEKE